MNRKQELMNNSLDGNLSPEEERQLARILQEDHAEADTYDKLQQVDALLRKPPHERAPQRLALNIMARIAQAVKEERLKGQQDLNEMAEAVLEVALTTVTVATLPLLIGASWMMLNSKSDPEKVEQVLAQVTGLFILTIDVIMVMLEEAQAAYADDPEAAMAMITMIPPTLLTLVREVLGIDLDAMDETED